MCSASNFMILIHLCDKKAELPPHKIPHICRIFCINLGTLTDSLKARLNTMFYLAI